jgi:hypothetical protein
MALRGGFKNFANQTREIKEAPPIDLGGEAPTLHIVHEAAALHNESQAPSTEQADAPVPAADPAPESSRGVKSDIPGTHERTNAHPSSTQTADEAELPIVSSHTHYTELVRKELRLHADQADELTVLATRVQRARREKGERITDNTLIRVAVDLLLQRQNELVGSTEDELRVALGLAPRA